MEKQNNYQPLLESLQSLTGMLDLEPESTLHQDVISLGNYLANPIFRIAVFAPFNYGKSTLINALLGNRTLPIDLIPTTGAAIQVSYGDKLQTKITLRDGRIIREEGTKILQEYARLDEQRCMRDDVTKVEVFCPHPFLKTGVEFLDLPGTDDREAQDNLVKEKLLTADLIIQVLDARKLMTLGERENLRDWLLDRGINTVVFVVNFLNLLDPEEQKQVKHRLRFVAESFRSELPTGISNLYQVDALPALRARLKGDTNAAQTTGLATFETALQHIVQVQKQQQSQSLSRVIPIANQVIQIGEEKAKVIESEINLIQEKQQEKVAVLEKAQQLLRQGLERSISEFQGWLYLPKLLKRYQTEIAVSLRPETQDVSKEISIRKAALEHQKNIMEWVNKAWEFFGQTHPGELTIDFLTTPQVNNPETNTITSQETSQESSDDGMTPVAIATGIGLVFGGPVGGAFAGGASYVLRKAALKLKKSSSSTSSPDEEQLGLICAEAAKEYLQEFSKINNEKLEQYTKKAEKVFNFSPPKPSPEITSKSYQLQLLNNLLTSLKEELKANS